MAKVSPLQGNFSGGEFSPLLYGRVDADRYKTGLKKCFNFIPALQGGLPRRSGTYYVDNYDTVRGSASKKIRLIPFLYTEDQAYVIELGDAYFRVLKDRGVILDGSTEVGGLGPYTESQLFEVSYAQSADVLYTAHKSVRPKKFTRISNTFWTSTNINFEDGPYLPIGDSRVVMSNAATTGSDTITVAEQNITGTASSGGLILVTIANHGFVTGDRIYIRNVTGTTEANGTWTITKVSANTFTLSGSTYVNAYVAGGTASIATFSVTDAVDERPLRIQQGSTWSWAIITGYTNPRQVTVTHQTTAGATGAMEGWRLGAFSSATGFPSSVCFHEDRLCFNGTGSIRNYIYASNSGDYENFAPSDSSGTVVASNGFALGINSSDSDAGRWLTSDDKGLVIGASSGEFVMKPANPNEALSALNVKIVRASAYGSAEVQALQLGKSSLFIQRGGRKVRELSYFYDVDGFRAPDLSEIAEHITGSGITCVAVQRIPQQILWMVREDGALIGMTYERDGDGLRIGFHHHVLGGVSDVIGSDAVVESVTVIPTPDGTSEDVWLSVKRYINGSTTRYIEYLTQTFNDQIEQEDGFFVDCGLTYDAPKTVTGITKANPGVVTITGHGFSNGDEVVFKNVYGMTEVNDETYTVTNKTANTFELYDNDGNAIDTSGFGTYISGGECRKKVSTITGLSHLEGETVTICADGAKQASQVVSAGAISLPNSACTVHVGYGYTSQASLLRLEAGAQDGTSLGKIRRINRASFMLHRTLGLKVGTDFDDLETIAFRKQSDPMGRATPLFSGIKNLAIKASDDTENYLCMEVSDPVPATILAVMPQLETQDR